MVNDKEPDTDDVKNPQEGRLPADAPVDPLAVSTAESERDEDEETWTNQPPSSDATEFSDRVSEDELDDEEELEQAPLVKKPIQNGRDVVCEELPARAVRAKIRLRPYLTGTIAIELTNLGERYLFDWRGEEPKVSLIEGQIQLAQGEPSDATKVDCIVSLTEQSLMSVRSGDLNPQLAMLADKIKIRGKAGPAVYLFNLVAPRERH